MSSNIAHLIKVASNEISRSVNDFASAYDLTGTQVQIIDFLTSVPDNEDVFQKDIEAKFHLSGATVTNMLKSLEKNGYIVRTPMENDARLKRIELTQKALDHENRVRENIMVIEEAMHEGFSKEEFNMMLGFLDRVIDNMEKLNK